MTEYHSWEVGFYKPGEQAAIDSPRGRGILAIKAELHWLGTGRQINLTHASYGDAAVQAAKDFQSANALTPDGVIGPRTCKALFNSRVKLAEVDHEIPNRYLCRLLDLESAWYPSAWNSDGDTGLAQVNLKAHPSVTAEEAYDPAFSIPWAAQRLQMAHALLAKTVPEATWTRKWWASVFAHNAPSWAVTWLKAGCPATGGDEVTIGGKEWLMFEWATRYVQVVLNRTC